MQKSFAVWKMRSWTFSSITSSHQQNTIHNILQTSFIQGNKQFSTNLNLHQYHHQPDGVNALYFPYGKADFASIRRSKQFYVDKTRVIPLLEKSGDQLFFVRPPRWGKSLLLSMLKSYYDINNKQQFNELFGGLWIGKPENHTPLKNEFHVLHFDFSIDVSGSPEDIKQALFNKINSAIHNFVEQNGLNGVDINPTDALVTFDNLVYCSQRNKFKLMVLIDEYDRFANKLMFENPERYKLIVEGKRGDATSSPIRSFFERLKQASTSGLADFRSLIVGITPISLADASGYNVAENIAQLEIFGDVVGFTENDLRIALDNIGIINDHQNNAISNMKRFYNGYHFPGSTQPLFNPTLSMYFLKKLMNDIRFKNDVIEGKDIPLITMTDNNTKISENVFSTLATTPVSIPIIQQLTATNIVQINTSIVGSFKLRDIIDPPTNEKNEKQVWDNTLSFMYYHGMLTFLKDFPKTLTIPNEISKVQYLEQLAKLISLTQNDVMNFVTEPTEQNLKLLLDNILCKQETIYDNNMSEGGLQASIESALRAFCLYKFNPFKSIRAEKEYKLKNQPTKFADLVLETEKNVFIIEFKRIRPKYIIQYSEIEWFPQVYKKKFTELLQQDENSLLMMQVQLYENSSPKIVTVSSILNNAIQQVKQYGEREKNNNKSKNIHKFVVVQVGWPLIVKQVF